MIPILGSVALSPRDVVWFFSRISPALFVRDELASHTIQRRRGGKATSSVRWVKAIEPDQAGCPACTMLALMMPSVTPTLTLP